MNSHNEKQIKQQKRKQAQTTKIYLQRFEELSEDPMGTVLAGIFLLSEELKQIIDSIRSEYEIELPHDLQNRESYVKRKLTRKHQEKIWKRIYQQVGEVEEIKEFQQAAVELAHCPTLLTKILPTPKRKPGRPKRRWTEWPQLDIARTLFHWLLTEIIWPLPRYFYNPELRLSREGMPMTIAVFSSMSGKILAEDGTIIKRDRGKRDSDTLIRDAYYFLLRNEREPKRQYIELAQYALKAELEEIEYHPEREEDKYDEALLRISRKIAKCCTRHKQWISNLLDSPA